MDMSRLENDHAGETDATAMALRSRFLRAPLATLLLISFFALGATWLVVMVVRTTYPFHLEWLESNVFLHAVRIAQGHGLYEAPLEGLVSHPYPPLYYLVLAALFQVTTPSLITGRIVSLCAALWCAASSATLAARRSDRPRLAFATTFAAFLALFPATGAWLDLVRVDTLAVALWLQGVVLVYAIQRTGRRFALATLCFIAASLTKQTCLPLAGAAWICAPLARRPRIWFLGGLLTLAASLDLYAWLDLQTNGWLAYYTVTLPMGHETEPRHALILVQGFVDLFAIWSRAPFDLSANLRASLDAPAILPSLGLTLGCLLLIATPARRDRLSLPMLALTTALVCSWSATKQGAYLNHYLPLAAFAAVGIGHTLAFTFGTRPNAMTRWLVGLQTVILLGTLALITEDPRHHLPTADDRRAGEAWVRWLRSVDGDVQMPALNYLPYLAGKDIHPNEMGLFELYNDLRRHASNEETLERMADHPSISALLLGRTTCLVDARLEEQDASHPRRTLSMIGGLLDSGVLPYERRAETWPYATKDTFRCRIGDRLRPEVIFTSRFARAHAVPAFPELP